MEGKEKEREAGRERGANKVKRKACRLQTSNSETRVGGREGGKVS